MGDRELYSIEDARFLLGGIARKTIYDLLSYGELASVVIGRRRFIPAAAIANFIDARTTRDAPSERPAKGRTRSGQMPELKPLPATGGRRRSATRR